MRPPGRTGSRQMCLLVAGGAGSVVAVAGAGAGTAGAAIKSVVNQRRY